MTSASEPQPGTALAPHRPSELVLPTTGELVDLRDPRTVALAQRHIRDAIENAHAAKRILDDVLVEESTRVGTKTLRLDGVTAVVSGSPDLQWDVTVLIELLAAGLPTERYNDLVTEEVSYKVNQAVAKQIEAVNPVYAEIIGRARTRIPKRPTVKVDAGG